MNQNFTAGSSSRTSTKGGRKVSFSNFILIFATLMALVASAVNVKPAHAAAVLTITPITWNVIGLDSNNVSVGPNNFPVGVRVCNTGDAAATGLSATFTWDTAATYINSRPGSLTTIALASLANGSCHDFYLDRKSTRLNSSHIQKSRMPSSA